MKKVLITGINSYIGNSFAEYAAKYYPDLYCDKISLREQNIENIDLREYDAILHVAGIAHVDVKKADEETKKKYYEINCDLSCQLAEKAKADGVSQFVYLSSMIIFGDSAPMGKTKTIDADTNPAPAGFYGDSKLKAEEGLKRIAEADMGATSFNLSIVRPPMVFGRESKGNYPRLSRLAVKSPIFPKVENSRSMIYIGNLCELLCQLIEQEKEGTFMPQNASIISTTELVQLIAKVHGKNIHVSKAFNWCLKVLSHYTGYVNKVFGSFTYDDQISQIVGVNYQKYAISEAIEMTEGKK